MNRSARLTLTAFLLASCALSGTAARALEIAVIGGTGRVGSRVVAEALSRGHSVIGTSRTPDAYVIEHANFSTTFVDAYQPDSLRDLAARDLDAIVVSVSGNDFDGVDSVVYKTVEGLLTNVSGSETYVIVIGGASLLDRGPGIPRASPESGQGHALTLEMLRATEDVTWSYLSPAGNFLDSDPTGEYTLGGEEMVRPDHGEAQGIPYGDFAAAVVDELERRTNAGKLFNAQGGE